MGRMPQTKDKEWLNDMNTRPCICCLQETHLKTRDTYGLKVKGWKKIFHAHGAKKKAGVAILISEYIGVLFVSIQPIVVFWLGHSTHVCLR